MPWNIPTLYIVIIHLTYLNYYYVCNGDIIDVNEKLSDLNEFVDGGQSVVQDGISLENTYKNTEAGDIYHETTNDTSFFSEDDESYYFGVLHTLEKYGEWATKEEKIVEMLTKRLELMDSERKLIERYLEDYEDSTGAAMKNLREPKSTPEERGRVVGSSAVLGHRMVHRYSSVLSDLRTLLKSSEYLENTNQLNETLDLNDTMPWVGTEDMFMSMTAFLHFKEVYQFHPEELINGLEYDTMSGGKMNNIHTTEIAIFALYRDRYVYSVEWLENEMIKKSDMSSDLTSSLLSVSIQQHNRIINIPNTDLSYERFVNLYNRPINARTLPSQRLSSQYIAFIEHRGLPGKGESPVLNADAQYADLCMGNKLQTPAMAKNLKCYYENKRHPYLYLNPIKTEHLSENPPVYQYYEMVGNQTNELLQNTYGNLVTPSGVVGSHGIESVSIWRTSAGTGMINEEVPKKIYSLAEIVSGLKIWNNSEPTQYVEYTYGRFYTQHRDAFEGGVEMLQSVEKYGDRIATILYYLELPKEGGFTPLCQAGIWAHPVRGSAILWYNMYRNGTCREDVNHGACPVIHGHKIIMNHWIRHHGNWNHHKCSLNQFDEY